MTEQLFAGMKGIMELAGSGATELMDEALNLFIVLSVLDILKFASVFVVFYIVKKYLDSIIAVSENEKTTRLVQSAKVSGLIISIIFFVSHSYGGVINIAKVLVAPKIFLMEKGYDVMKEVKK